MKKVRAYANIALIKYWGKKDENLNIPYYDTISVTLDAFYTDVSILKSDKNELIINGSLNDKSDKFIRLENHLNLLNTNLNIKSNYKVITKNNFPMGVGLASSASSYASITYGYFLLNEMEIDLKEISTWARRGSGSATRSLHGGFVKWNQGFNHNSSYAELVLDSWDEFRIVVINLDKTKKKISSREAMKRAVILPVYNEYVNKSKAMYEKVIKALKSKDFSTLGSVAEENALMLHNIIEMTAINYLSNEAKKLFALAKSLRDNKIETYVTADAGDSICFLVLEDNLSSLLKELKGYDYIVSNIGGVVHEL